MDFKYIRYILILTVFLLSGCGVSAHDSNIQYNKLYENIQIEGLECGKNNQLTYIDNEKEKKLYMEQVDCLYLMEHRDHLKKLGNDEIFSIDFISNGEFIDGVIINE